MSKSVVITVKRWAVGIKHKNGEIYALWSHAIGATLYDTRREAREVSKANYDKLPGIVQDILEGRFRSVQDALSEVDG